MRRSLGFGVGLLLLAGVTAQGEEPTATATAELVRIEVVVTDARGEPVRDLSLPEFAVQEDGRPQQLSAAVFVGTPVMLVPVRRLSMAGVAATPLFPRDRQRHVAIIVDELHLSPRGVETARQALRRFLDDVAAPEDEIAFVVVGAPRATVQPTRDRAALLQAAERIHARGDAVGIGQGSQLTPEQAEQILRGDPSALKLAARLEVETPGSAYGGRFVPRNVASGPVPAGIDPGEVGAAIDAERQAHQVLADALAVSSLSLRTLEHVLRGMALLGGRKLCLFVSDGFLIGRGTSEEQSQRLQLVIDAATRASTAVYPLFAAGLGPVGGDASAVGNAGPAGLRDRVARFAEQQRIETLEGLADETGGLLLRGADAIDLSLTRILREDAATYLLAYAPSNPQYDGRFRRISVQLPRHRDYVVRARKGYFAPRSRGEGDGAPGLD